MHSVHPLSMITLRGKTNLACDTCRQRKSRCDGIRPVCSHCRRSGRPCTYRPTPTNLETDESVLSRLAAAEKRILALEGGMGLGGGIARRQSDEPVLPAATLPFSSPPDLHTAAAYKILHCWPRIRLNMTIPGLVSQTYLAACDQADPMLLEWMAATDGNNDGDSSRVMPRLEIRQATRAVVSFYSSLAQFPAFLTHLIDHYAGLRLENVATGILGEGDAHTMDQASACEPKSLNLLSLSVAQLLVLSMAMRSVEGDDPDAATARLAPSERLILAAAAEAVALQKQWLLRAGPDEDLVPLLLAMSHSLVHLWARPFHALGILQSIDPAIRHMSVRQPGDPRVQCYSRLHFLLESDILSEIDGFPSATSLPLLWSTPTAALHAPAAAFVENQVKLRSQLNRILRQLYVPDKAYAQPDEMADVVYGIAADLHLWYQQLPLEDQFVRDVTIFSMHVPAMDAWTRETALRYFACIFLLHRPVVYFFLHRDMEYTVRPPDVRSLHFDREPWILESCRACIESAVLIIYFLGLGITTARSWTDTQLLFAVYLILLQVRAVPGLSPVLRLLGDDFDGLLDRVERLLEMNPVRSVKVDRSLDILRNERENFDVSSPGTNMSVST